MITGGHGNCHQHLHCNCEHCLHYCSICNLVYCCKCGKQWYANNYSQWISVSTIPFGGMTSINTTSCGGHSHI